MRQSRNAVRPAEPEGSRASSLGLGDISAVGLPPAGEAISLFQSNASAHDETLRRAATDIARKAFASASAYDWDGAYPVADVRALHERGLLAAPLPREFGGVALDGLLLAEILRRIGSGSLPLGRLLEGHVNAVALVARYGRRDQIAGVADDVRAGKLLAVWNTDDKDGLRLIEEDGRRRLEGRKILASGAGHIERPIVTATDESGKRLMVMPQLVLAERADLSNWLAHGMRASASGAVDLSGIVVSPCQIIGNDGDYERQPAFSGGAWRFAAVQLGGMGRLLDLLRQHLRRTGRGGDPHQAARLGEAAIATETASLWVGRAAALAAEGTSARSPDQIVAYVDLARLAVERTALDLLELVHRSVGLQGFMRPDPIELVSRDLATYLRQPGPDRALVRGAAWVLESPAPSEQLWN